MYNTTKTYQLPHPSAEFESLLLLANNSNAQAQSAESSAGLSMTLNDKNFDEILSIINEDKDSYKQPVHLTTEAMFTAINSALAVRQAEYKALESIYNKIFDIFSRQQAKIKSIEKNIEALQIKAKSLRSDYSEDFNAEIFIDMPSNDAQKLLDVLETLHSQQNLLQGINERRKITQINIDYLTNCLDSIQAKIKVLDDLKPLTKQRQDRINVFFSENTDQNKNQKEIDLHTKDEVDDDGKSPKKRLHIGALIWTYSKIIIVAFLISFIIRIFLFDITHVEGLSMYPTLNDSDDLLNSKSIYFFTEPDRGDIVIFDAPDAPGEDYVKRIIGLPNEEVIISRGLVYINDDLLHEPYLLDGYTHGDIKMVIPDGFYFVMGDNRAISRDSRDDDVGVISIDQINGKSIFRVYPFAEFGGLKNI